MINDIITAIATVIHGQYPDANIYTEPVEQGLVEPAFYIHCIDVDQRDRIAGRFIQSMPFEVVYFPINGVSDINSTLPVLLVALKLITLENGQKLAGYNIKGQVIDDVLHVFVDYDVVVKVATDPADNMEELKITGGTNG